MFFRVSKHLSSLTNWRMAWMSRETKNNINANNRYLGMVPLIINPIYTLYSREVWNNKFKIPFEVTSSTTVVWISIWRTRWVVWLLSPNRCILIGSIRYRYLEPKWPLFLKVNPPKTRPFPIKTRVIWVSGIHIWRYVYLLLLENARNINQI